MTAGCCKAFHNHRYKVCLCVCVCVESLRGRNPGEATFHPLLPLLCFLFFSPCTLCSFPVLSALFSVYLFFSHPALSFCKPLTVIIWGHLEVQINSGLGGVCCAAVCTACSKTTRKKEETIGWWVFLLSSDSPGHSDTEVTGTLFKPFNKQCCSNLQILSLNGGDPKDIIHSILNFG